MLTCGTEAYQDRCIPYLHIRQEIVTSIFADNISFLATHVETLLGFWVACKSDREMAEYVKVQRQWLQMHLYNTHARSDNLPSNELKLSPIYIYNWSQETKDDHQSKECTLEHKVLLDKAVIKPIWTYGIQLWDSVRMFHFPTFYSGNRKTQIDYILIKCLQFIS